MQRAPLIAHSRPLAPSSGFTAIELMVVVAIVAILVSMAVPSFGGIIERYRVRRASEDLTATLYFARSEAMRRGGNVTLRKLASAGCPTTAPNDWSCGWVVFEDAGEKEIQVSPAPKGVKVTAGLPNPPTYLKVDRWGRFHNLGFNFKVKPATADVKDETGTRLLCVSSGGRLQVKLGVGKCT